MSCNNLKAPLDGAFYYYGHHVLRFPIDFIRTLPLFLPIQFYKILSLYLLI